MLQIEGQVVFIGLRFKLQAKNIGNGHQQAAGSGAGPNGISERPSRRRQERGSMASKHQPFRTPTKLVDLIAISLTRRMLHDSPGN